jgi:hypothetical protein
MKKDVKAIILCSVFCLVGSAMIVGGIYGAIITKKPTLWFWLIGGGIGGLSYSLIVLANELGMLDRFLY